MDEGGQLEEALRADANDARAWAVYGDWLLGRGDPAGEALSLWGRLRSGTLPRGERAALCVRYRELCDPALRLAGLPEEVLARTLAVPEENLSRDWEDTDDWDSLEAREGPALISELEWRHGFVVGATVRPVPDSPWAETLATFCASPVARLLSRLTVSGLQQEDVEPLLATGLLSRVRALRVEETSTAAFAELISSPALHPLDRLSFTAHYMDDDGEPQEPEDDAWVESLVQSPAIQRLRALLLRESGLGVEALQRLASCEGLAHLETLELSQNPFGAEGAEVLASAPVWRELRELGVGSCELGDDGVALLADSEALRGLRKLDVRDNHLRIQAAEALASSRLVELTHLDIGHNSLRPAGLRALFGAPALSELQVLRAESNLLDRRYEPGGATPHAETFHAFPQLVEFSVRQGYPGLERNAQQLADRQVEFYCSLME